METAPVTSAPTEGGRHRELLASAARIYERHRASRRPRFNVFTTLRSARDEVNLHSRFLHAVLAPPGDVTGDNLAAFLSLPEVAVDGVDAQHAQVAREANHIDLLVTDSKQAVVIENKLGAPDGKRQLQRYHESLRSRYAGDAIHLVYLTLDGRDPSEQSVGKLPCRAVSYADLIPWLTECQQRAFDEPALRESIGQYVRLIRQLTGTDQSGVYMRELTDLLLQDEENLVIASHLSGALCATKVKCVLRLWETIDATLREAIPGLPGVDPARAHLATEDHVAKSLNTGVRKSHYTGLYYRIREGAWFCVIEDDWLYFGVECDRSEYAATYKDLRAKLADVASGTEPEDLYPWWRYPSNSPNLRQSDDASLQMLASRDSHRKLADEIAADARKIWDRAKGGAG